MTTEQQKALEAVQFAIQMEIDGKEYYLKISRECNSELGRELSKTLAAEEDIHRQKFVAIYEAIRHKKTWPVIILEPTKGKELRTIFAQASAKISSRVKVLKTELKTIQIAMGMESKSYDYYKSQEKRANYEAEREFYRKLAAEENRHHQLLLDYYEYLEDTAGYFVKKEHPSLDAG